MKVCKNCGRQTDDSKVRCPHCGYLFEEDMDHILSKMKDNLSSCKKEYTEPAATAPQASVRPSVRRQAPVPPASATGRPATNNGQQELIRQVAQLKDEVRALQGEIGKMQTASGQPGVPPCAQSAVPPQYVQMPAPMLIYPSPQYMQTMMQQPCAAQEPEKPQAEETSVSQETEGKGPEKAAEAVSEPDVPKTKAKSQKKENISSRSVLALLSLVLLCVSVSMFFLPWMQGLYGFSGLDAVKNLFAKEPVSVFEDFIVKVVEKFAFAGGETAANMSRTICVYVLRYGIPVYAASFLFGAMLLVSVSGRVRMKAWHVFFALISVLASVSILSVICLVQQNSQLTAFLTVAAAADALRLLLLLFYRGRRAEKRKHKKK